MFGQVVIGPPGSGKTTYCHGMQQFLSGFKRNVVIINLDPANDTLPYKCDIDLSELINLSEVMEELKLGPNGGLIYCMEYLEKNLDWLKEKLSKYKNHYFLFDCPGQVELYTHNNAVKNIVERLTKWNYRLAAVHLVDSHYCVDPSKFISILLTSLSTMLQIALPHVNVLSKADLVEKYGRLAFNLDFYTDVLDLNYLMDHLQDDPFFRKYKKLNEALVGIVEDYGLVSFTVLDVQDKACMLRVMQNVDKANGYVFGENDERTLHALMSCAAGAEFEYEKIANIQEKHMDSSGEPMDEKIANIQEKHMDSSGEPMDEKVANIQEKHMDSSGEPMDEKIANIQEKHMDSSGEPMDEKVANIQEKHMDSSGEPMDEKVANIQEKHMDSSGEPMDSDEIT